MPNKMEILIFCPPFKGVISDGNPKNGGVVDESNKNNYRTLSMCGRSPRDHVKFGFALNRVIQTCKPFEGVLAPSVYGEMTINPSDIDYGIVTETTTTNISMCCEYDTAKTLMSVEQNGTLEDITMIGLDVPREFAPRECVTFQIVVSANNPSSFAGGWTFTFSNNEVVTLSILGERDSSKSYLIENNKNIIARTTKVFSYQTAISRTMDGTSNKAKINEHARELLSCNAMVTHKAQFNAIDLHRGASVNAGDWFSCVNLDQGIKAGDAVINADMDGFNGLVNESVAIISRANASYEIVRIKAITPDYIELDSPIENDYHCATLLPVKSFYIEQASTELFVNHRKISLSLEGRFFNTSITRDGDDQEIDGFKMLGVMPSQLSASKSVDYGISKVDYKRGVFSSSASYKAPIKKYSLKFVSNGSRQFASLLGFFKDHYGSYSDFLCPTFTSDFEVLNDGVIGGQLITEDNQGGLINGKNNIFALGKNGSITAHKVVSFDSLNDGLLSLSISPEISLERKDLEMVGYCNYSYFGDSLSVNRTGEIYESSIEITEIQRGYDE